MWSPSVNTFPFTETDLSCREGNPAKVPRPHFGVGFGPEPIKCPPPFGPEAGLLAKQIPSLDDEIPAIAVAGIFFIPFLSAGQSSVHYSVHDSYLRTENFQIRECLQSPRNHI